jgi:hypothetical protein
MFKNLMGQSQDDEFGNEDITIDKIITNDEIDDTFIAAFGGFK